MNLKKALKQEDGAALILALIILAIGSLLLVPLLSFVGSSFRTVDRVYDQKAYQLYAADAGVRDAIFKIQNYPEELPPVGETSQQFFVAGKDAQVGPLNGKDVSYTIEGIDPTLYHSAAAYRITSVAADPDNSGNQTIVQADVDFIDFFTTYTQNAITASDDGAVTNSGGGKSNPIVYGNIQSSSADAINIYSQLYSTWLSEDSSGGSDYIDVENHVINNIFIIDGGSGYTTTPTITISDNGTNPSGSGAAVSANVTGGVITSINVSNSGSDYKTPDINFIPTDGGAGAYAVAHVDNNGSITSITILNGGTNYITAPTISISEDGVPVASGAQATATVTNGTVTSITVTNGGSGYTAPEVNITDISGSGAIAVATVTDLSTFPVNGSILVGSGNKAETLDYNYIDSNSNQISLITLTKNDHNAGDPVNLINETNATTVLGWPWSPSDPTNNPVQNYYYKQAQLSNVPKVSGGVIDLSANTIQGQPYNGGPLYVNGDATITTSNHLVTLNSSYSNRIIYVDGVLNFDNKCQLLLNGYTIFASSTLGSPLDHPNSYAMNFGTQSIIGGPGALIANGSIYFAPKITNNNEYLYVMSIMGSVQFQPQGDFSGSVAGYTGVTMQPGTSITWGPAPSGLNLPGQDQTLVLGDIKVWKIN